MSDKFINKIVNRVKKISNAIDIYTKVGKIPAMPSRAFVNLADYLFLTGCVEQSEELLNNAINFASSSPDAYMNLGFLKQTQGDFQKAVEYYKKALKKDKKNAKALCMWGNCLYHQNNYDDAIKKYEKAIEINEKFGEGYLCWGIVLLKKKDYKEAREKFKFATKYSPQDARGLYMQATVEIELGLYDDALEKLQFIVSATEYNFNAYHNIAYIYFKKKEYDKTIMYAETALKITQFKLETYLLLGDTYVILGKYKEAFNIYEIAEKQNLKSMFLYLSWGIAYQNKNKYDKALELFKKGIEIDCGKANDELYARMARCYFELGNIDEAKINSSKAVEISANNAMANEIIADILIHEHNYAEAINKLEICLKSSEYKQIAFRKIAECYALSDDYIQSNKYYQKAIEYNREDKFLLLAYIESLYKQGNYQDALKKIITLEKLSNDEFEILSIIFKVNYNIAKGDLSAYNRMKAISVAEKIKEKYPESFYFEDEYNELKNT